MQTLRRLTAPLVVTRARLRAHPGRSALVVLGIAAATAFLVGVLGASLAAQDRELRRSVAQLPLSQRAFRVDAFGLIAGQDDPATERRAGAALATLSTRAPVRASFLRALDIGGESVVLGGVDDVAGLVRLQTGRLPKACGPVRCEVVQIGTGSRALFKQPGLELVRTGVGTLGSQGLFGSALQATLPANGHATLLLANGAGAIDRLSGLAGFFLVRSWIASIDPRALHVWQVSGVLARESRVQTALAPYQGTFQLSGPDDALTAARERGSLAAQRMILVGAEIAALLLGFSVVCATGLRRGVGNERRRLRQRGATRFQIGVAVGGEVAAMATAGVVAGAAIGAAAVAVVAGATDLPAGALLAHSVWTPRALGIVGGAWLASLVVLAAAVSVPDTADRRRVSPVDVAAIGAAATVAFAAARGSLDGTGGGSVALLVGLPLLVCFAAGVATIRLLGPVMRLADRYARRGPLTLRLALLALARAPARSGFVAAFLVVSFGLALFAADYRATLTRDAHDEAGFAVPTDIVLGEGPALVRPLEAASLEKYRRLAPATVPSPVLRQPAELPGTGTSALSADVVGIPAQTVATIAWRSDYSSSSQQKLARRLGALGPATLRGIAVPATTSELSLSVGRERGGPAALALVVRLADGEVTTVQLGPRLRVRLRSPGELRSVIGLQLLPPPSETTQLAHRAAETGSAAPAAGGSLTLGRLVASNGRDRQTLTDWHGFVARGGTFDSETRTVSFGFTTGRPVIVRLPQATDGRPLPVLVSPDVARAVGGSGALTLDFGDTTVPAQIVGVANRFPAAAPNGGAFVVADESRLSTALDADAPGTGTPGELWLSAPPQALAGLQRQLGRPPFDRLQLASQRGLERALASNPLARGIELSLLAAAALALALATLGLWATASSDLHDERGEYFDLEAQGVPPVVLRRQLWLRSFVVLALGAAGGVGVGLLVSRIVVYLVRTSASATLTEPPLVSVTSWLPAAVAFLVVAAAAAGGVALAARAAFRGDTPERSAWSLE